MPRFLFLLFLSLAPLLAREPVSDPQAPTSAQPTLPTKTLTIGRESVIAEIAEKPAELEAGLMFRESLADNHGMLFVMPTVGPVSFWMKNTKIPLSIAYIDPRGAIAEIHELQPFNETPVRSLYPQIAYALEMPQGWFTKKNIWPGEKVSGLPAPAPLPE